MTKEQLDQARWITKIPYAYQTPDGRVGCVMFTVLPSYVRAIHGPIDNTEKGNRNVIAFHVAALDNYEKLKAQWDAKHQTSSVTAAKASVASNKSSLYIQVKSSLSQKVTAMGAQMGKAWNSLMGRTTHK